MPYIKTYEYEEAADELRSVYDSIIGSRGKLAEVHKIQSLNPTALLAHMDLYKVVMFGNSPLKRYQREMMAVVVSAANQCRYCVEHHKQALLFYWKDEEKVKNLLTSPNAAGLGEADVALCEFAQQITLTPHETSKVVIANLQALGFDDRAILDAVQVIAYFNFVNRFVLSLGVDYSDDEATGYKY